MQPLNIQDRVMVSLHESLRRRGHAGLLLQSHLHLKGRLDEATLRTALSRLSRCYPVVGARLKPGGWFQRPQWDWDAEATCPLTVSDLGSDDDADVHRYAEQLFATPLDLRRAPPVSFHLLRRPGGKDVVLLQWAHALMDGMGGELLLREVNRLQADPAATATTPPPGDAMLEYFYGHPFGQRLKACLALVRDLPAIGLPTNLIDLSLPRRHVEEPAIVLRRLDAARTTACLERVKRLCGFANVMPVLVAAAFRAVSRVAPQPPGRFNLLYTHAPINLRASTAGQTIFNNLQSYVRLQARPPQLGDREEIARRMQRQFRDQLRSGFDLAFLFGVEFLSGKPLLTDNLLRALSIDLTFVFGYHGTVDLGGDRFCGTPIEHVYTGLPTAWSPPGLSFAAHRYRDSLSLMASFIPGRVPESVANAFLDAVEEELISA